MNDWSLKSATKQKPANFNAMTEKLLRKTGWEVELTQSYNASARVSKDLWGFADLIAFMPDGPIVLVQACGSGHKNARLKKICESTVARKWIRQSNRLIWLVHWSKHTKNGQRIGDWITRIMIIDERDFVEYHRNKREQSCQ